MKLITKLLLSAILFSDVALAQDIITRQDYHRALGFLSENIINKKVFNANVQAHWFPDTSGLWFIHHSVEGKKYLKINLSDLMRSELFDHRKLAMALGEALGEEISANDLPISTVEYKNEDNLIIMVRGKKYQLDLRTSNLTEPKEGIDSNKREIDSPDGKWTAYVDNHNLFIKSGETGVSKQLSTDGKQGYEYATWYGWADIIEGENGKRPQHFAVSWSEDSEWISANICDLRSAKKMFLLDWSIDTLFRPKLLSYFRGSPGDTAMIYMEPVFYNVHTGKEMKPNLPRSTHINNTSVTWSDTPGIVYLQRQSRGYKNVFIYQYNLKTGHLDTLYSENSQTNIDNFLFQFEEGKKLMFFLSEKSGWRQIYSIQTDTRTEKRITEGTYYVNSIERIDTQKERIFFMASGKEDGRNPYYQHLYSISFDGTDLKLLTKEDCHHSVEFDPSGAYFVDNYSTVNTPSKTVLRSVKDGQILLELAQATLNDLSEWSPPEIFQATARDGETTIFGALWKPTNFDPSKRYPVVEMSYTGPHTHVFPKEFSRAFGLQSLAELGFIVVVVDGLGSAGRSKKFHNYSYKNLGGNLEDHVMAIRQLGKNFSWIDTTRVGIYGHSAGGYDAAHALLAYPDFYKVAVASSADHDHRMEKAWWPEMYMGWPVDSTYHLQSNITMADNLQGKLLITHGGIDENVNPSATLKLAEALIKADKQFDMLILPSQRHGYHGDHLKYFRKIRWNYFVEHLRGVTPIWNFESE